MMRAADAVARHIGYWATAPNNWASLTPLWLQCRAAQARLGQLDSEFIEHLLAAYWREHGDEEDILAVAKVLERRLSGGTPQRGANG